MLWPEVAEPVVSPGQIRAADVAKTAIEGGQSGGFLMVTAVLCKGRTAYHV